MKKRLQLIVRNLIVSAIQRLGRKVFDCRTGQVLGKGIIFPWGGKIHLIGFENAMVPVPMPQRRVTYWKQEIGFTVHDPVDFPRQLSNGNHSLHLDAPKVLLVLLDHRSPSSVEECLKIWKTAGFSDANVLLAYGGTNYAFDSIEVPNKIYLDDPRLRTCDHQRDRQSYRDILVKSISWLKGKDYTHVLFHEYDHLPVVSDLADRLLDRMDHEKADLLAYHLQRIDSSTNPHWLNNVGNTYEPTVTLSMLGTGHFWTREAWQAVATDTTHSSWYLELDMPTTAHRLGLRSRSLSDQSPYVRALPDELPDLEEAVKSGAWTLHPVKEDLVAQRVSLHLKSICGHP